MAATTAQVTRRGLLTLSVVAAGSLLVKPATTYAGSLWHTYSQTQRNTLIVNRGLQDLNAKVGLECKEWVRRVVASASGGAVYIPPTSQNGIGWYWQDSPDVVGMSKPFENLKPGEILQMHLRTDKFISFTGGYWTPHTAIVQYVTSYSVQFLDCNWNFDYTVRSHPVPFAYLYDRVIHGCSVYYIL